MSRLRNALCGVAALLLAAAFMFLSVYPGAHP